MGKMQNSYEPDKVSLIGVGFMTDLYALLGVARDASREVIHRSYRKLVKSAHPDAGGDEAHFNALVTAHEVLMDEQRRKLYDETGETSKQQSLEDWLKEFAIKALGDFLVTTYNSKQNPIEADLVAFGMDWFNEQILRVEKQLAGVYQARQRARKMAPRWHSKPGEENDMQKIMKSHLEEMDRMEKNHKNTIRGYELAMQMLSHHSFQFTVNEDMILIRGSYFYREATRGS